MRAVTTSDANRAAPRPDGALLLPYRGRTPRVHRDAWLAPGVVVIGDVEIGAATSLWYGTVVRGDVHAIRIGARTNLQDHCVVHVTRGQFATEIGDEVTVGHRAVVHGCTVRVGIDDGCDGGPERCVEGGFYCGGNEVVGDPRSLYRCQGGVGVDRMMCPNGCMVAPPLNDDFCR